MKIRIIGYGRLAQALGKRWIKHHELTVSSPRLSHVKEGNLQTCSSNQEFLEEQDCIILAVKPKHLNLVLNEIADLIPPDVPVISLAAGITLTQIKKHLLPKQTVIRAMPNIAGEIGESASLMMPEQAQGLEEIKNLFLELGPVYWVNDDNLLDLGTILTGSGPAYVFYFMQALSKAAQNLGMPEHLSEELVLQTVLGATKLSIQSPLSLEELQAQVTSPQGTTAAAIETLNQHQFNQALDHALSHAWQRILSLRLNTK